MDDSALRDAVSRWIEDDPEPAMQAELRALLEAGDLPGLRVRFEPPLSFGTAGLRGVLGAGPACMNRAMVARTTAAVCARLVQRLPDARQRGLCIGYDARHGSAAFAEEAAAVAAGAGFVCRMLERPGPTPLLAFAVQRLGAAAGVMITASHNPKQDNGYKLYLEHGAQLTAPEDTLVAEAMAAIESVRTLPRLDAAAREQRGLQEWLDRALERDYLTAIAGERAAAADDSGLCIVYTAMHGVGGRLMRAALARAGFSEVHEVAEQAVPDPEFPTVPFPNPEEPGAMDRLLALGERVSAQLALASDPDADRLAVGARDESGALVALTGNELGALLADHLLAQGSGAARVVIGSIVSTPLVARIAAAHGARFEPTLTGFKWICARARELEEEGLRFVLGFEEALGYAVGTAVRDKDGLGAAVVTARLAAGLQREGKSLLARRDELYRLHGAWVSGQVTVRLDGSDALARATARMSALRASPPDALAGRAVIGSADLLSGLHRGRCSLNVALPPSDLLIWDLEGGDRVAVRPSGTEPKLKLYLDVVEPVAADEPASAARSRARLRQDALAAAARVLLG